MVNNKPPIEVNLEEFKMIEEAIFPKKKRPAKGANQKEESSVVKIDSNLLAEVEEFISLEENKFRYVNRKQFIDLAVSEFLRREKKVKK